MNDELTKQQVADMLKLAPWQGRNPEAMYTEKFKEEHPDYMEIQPPPVYCQNNEPYLGLLDDEYMSHLILCKGELGYYWKRDMSSI